MRSEEEYYDFDELALEKEEKRKRIDSDKYISNYEKDYSGELDDYDEEIITDSNAEEASMQGRYAGLDDILDKYDSEVAYIISEYLAGRTDRLPIYEFFDEVRAEAAEVSEMLEERYEYNFDRKYTHLGIVSAGYGVLVFEDLSVEAVVKQNNIETSQFISPIREDCSRGLDFSNRKVSNLQHYLADYKKHITKKVKCKIK
ncbi:MAG: hypothetical protein IJI43_02750 [Bacilli bacterium]|nr:hypothetical protein [Bacilli bacterium]